MKTCVVVNSHTSKVILTKMRRKKSVLSEFWRGSGIGVVVGGVEVGFHCIPYYYERTTMDYIDV